MHDMLITSLLRYDYWINQFVQLSTGSYNAKWNLYFSVCVVQIEKNNQNKTS